MGTGALAFIFAIVGLIRYWGTNQFGGFVFVVILSYFWTDWVRKDVEQKGSSNPRVVLVAMVLQILVIVMGFLSLFNL